MEMHVPADELEAYALGRMTNDRAEAVEGHFLFCPDCLKRLQAEIEFITALRAAVQQDKPGG